MVRAASLKGPAALSSHEQAGGLVRLDARAQQQSQILAQGAHRQRVKFPFCHDASSFPM